MIYKGYQEISGTEDDFNAFFDLMSPDDWFPNEYLIFTNTETGKQTEMRWDGSKFVNLKLPPSRFIKAKNAQQRCALDMLMNENITAAFVLGGYGSGKTMLTLQMGIYALRESHKQDKILGVREAQGEGKSVGYLKGDFEDKTRMFFKPLEQQLAGQSFELEGMVRSDALEMTIPYYMKGTTYKDTIIVVDEAEDLTESQIRLVGTRVGENSRVFFSGDYNQSVLDKSTNNPLIKACFELRGYPNFACIYLEEDVRSETSKMFANLFKGSASV